MDNKIRKMGTPFTMVPNALIEDYNLKSQSRFLYAYLYSRPQDWTFHNSQLCKAMGCNEDTLRRYLNELKKAGWVEVNQIRQKGVFKNNEYVLYTEPLKSSDGKPSSEKTEPGKNRTGKTTGHNNTNPSNNTDSLNNNDRANLGNSPSLFGDKKYNTFRDSQAFVKSVFLKKFEKEAEAGINVDYYYNAVLAWSDTLPVRTKTQRDKALKTDNGWIATARQFMSRDQEKGKLRMVSGSQVSDERDKMLKFLNRS